MGETAVDTRREVEETREELGGTIAELRNRSEQAKETVKRRAPLVIAGVVVVAGSVVGAILVVRGRNRRRHPVRTAVERRVDRLRREREDLVELLSERIAEHRAQAERKANPLWRRTAAKALETAAVVGAGAAVRSAAGGGGARRR